MDIGTAARTAAAADTPRRSTATAAGKGDCPGKKALLSIAEYLEAVGVILFCRIGEFFKDRAVAQSREQIISAVDLPPKTVNLLVGKGMRTIGAEEANVGGHPAGPPRGPDPFGRRCH